MNPVGLILNKEPRCMAATSATAAFIAQDSFAKNFRGSMPINETMGDKLTGKSTIPTCEIMIQVNVFDEKTNSHSWNEKSYFHDSILPAWKILHFRGRVKNWILRYWDDAELTVTIWVRDKMVNCLDGSGVTNTPHSSMPVKTEGIGWSLCLLVVQWGSLFRLELCWYYRVWVKPTFFLEDATPLGPYPIPLPTPCIAISQFFIFKQC